MKNLNLRSILLLISFVFLFLTVHSLAAQELTADANTLLLLHFNGDANGAGGEPPVTISNVSYQTGVHGQGIYLGIDNILEYAAAGNIDEQTGTLEFWIKSDWDDTATTDHHFLQYGGVGGAMHFYKYPGPSFVAIVSLSDEYGGEARILWNNPSNFWEAGKWYHLAFSWDEYYLRGYFNGELVNEIATGAPLQLISSANFRLGRNYDSKPAEAVFDEVRISDVVRTAEEIHQSFLSGLAGQTVTGVNIEPSTTNLRPTWRKTVQVELETAAGTFDIASTELSWSSSDPAVAVMGSDGRVRALSAGTAVLTGAYSGSSSDITVVVTDPVLPPVYETIDPYLAATASGAIEKIPVLILRFLPTADGVLLDGAKAPGWWSLDPLPLSEVTTKIDAMDKRVKFGLEEGSRFRGYKDLSAPPYIGYKVVGYITIYETFPPGPVEDYKEGYPIYWPDYHAIFERFDVEHYVNDLGVREIWVWGGILNPVFPSYDPAVHDPEDFRGNWESNMSSPTTGDVSNSNGNNSDLPIYDHTYIVYGGDYRATQAGVIHFRGHQFERMFAYVNALQDGNTDLFWKKFVGKNDQGVYITGRCGWTHMPPNTTDHYDYLNPTLVASDIEDWRPDGGGQTKMVNVDTWADLEYDWPGDPGFGAKTETQWYLYWMQSFPGYNNQIPYGENVMSNWWEFIANWDQSIDDGLGLYREPPALLVSPVVFLQGPYDPGTGWMQDHLRSYPGLPMTEPYAGLGYTHVGGGGEETSSWVFDVSGPDAIVDWVFLELRDKNDFANVLATRSALLQRDGDVVDVDGLSPVSFADLPPDDYYLVIKHRNHLGAMTAAPVAVSTTAAIIDFTSDLSKIHGQANGIAVLADGSLGLFSGDFNHNGQVQNTDYVEMVQTIGLAGYLPGDFDLNGQVQNTDLQLKLILNIGRGESFTQ